MGERGGADGRRGLFFVKREGCDIPPAWGSPQEPDGLHSQPWSRESY